MFEELRRVAATRCEHALITSKEYSKVKDDEEKEMVLAEQLCYMQGVKDALATLEFLRK